jgi:hypothetical protein
MDSLEEAAESSQQRARRESLGGMPQASWRGVRCAFHERFASERLCESLAQQKVHM